MIWSNILELLINFKLEFATLAWTITPFGPYGFYKQVNNLGQLEFKSLKIASINNGALCYETDNEVVVFIGNTLPPNSNNDIYLADTPEDVANIPTAGLNAGDLVYIISTESYQSWDGDSWEDYTPGEPLTPPLADILDQGNTSGLNDIVFDEFYGLQFNNNSRLREGTIDAGLGGSKGIAQICGAGYELKWEAGRLYVMGSSGNTIRQSLYNFNNIPTATDDSDLGYTIGSLWTLDDGTTYECIDATPASAEWIKTNQSKFIEVTKTELSALEIAETLIVNIWYKITDAVSNTKVILVTANNNSSLSKAAINLTDNNFGEYDISIDGFTPISGGTSLNLEVNGTPNGDQTLLNLKEGTNITISDNGTGNVTIASLADRYKTTSNTSNTISNGAKTFNVDANLAYIPLQEVLIVNDPTRHMHGTVTAYNSTTGQLDVDVKTHTGSAGPYTSWVINLDGVPVDAITGVGVANRLAYFTAAQVIDDAAAITAARALISDANGIPIHSATTSVELGYLSGVTGAIQTQINGKENTITNLPINKGGTNSTTALNNNRVMQSSSGAIVEASAITASRALKSDANGIPTHFDTATEPSLTELARVKNLGSQAVGISDTNELTNKRVTPRTGTIASATNPTINTDNVDFFSITAQTADIANMSTNLTGTPREGQTLWIAITGTASRAITTWGTSFESSGNVILPTTTVSTTRLDVAFIWNTVTSKWRCVGVA